jgi:hypothetical protein
MTSKYYQFSEEHAAAFEAAALEHYDFTTCQRPDGSKYGSNGRCIKGSETTNSDDEGKGGKLAVGGAAGYADVTAAIKADMGDSFDSKHEKVFQDRYAKAADTKKLGSIHKKAIKDLDNDDLEAKEGVLNSMKKAMKNHLEANQASGKGAKREAELAAMSPEQRRKAATEDRIKRGIKNKVVKSR